jgi:hypothetical protein
VGRRRGLCGRWVGVDATHALVSQQKRKKDTKRWGNHRLVRFRLRLPRTEFSGGRAYWLRLVSGMTGAKAGRGRECE